MPNLIPSPKSLLEQRIALETDAPTRLEAIALSDESYLQRVRQYAVLRFGEHVLRDFIWSAIIGPGIVGGIALLAGEVSVTTFLWALLALCALFTALFMKHVVEAPSEIDNIVRTHLARRQTELLAERAKPQLYGEIICVEDDARLDQVDNDYDCFITLCVEVRNREKPTSIATFSLDLWWENQDHPGTHEPVDGYYVETFGREPGKERSRHAIRTTKLTKFPYDEEINTTNQKRGWLRFSFGSLPPDMVDRDRLGRNVIIDLTAFDNHRNPHTIYKGILYKGPVERMAGCGKIKREPEDEFFFA